MFERKVLAVAEPHAKRHRVPSAAAWAQSFATAGHRHSRRRRLGVGVDVGGRPLLRAAEQKIEKAGARRSRRGDNQRRGQRAEEHGSAPFQPLAMEDHHGKASQMAPTGHTTRTCREGYRSHRGGYLPR